VHKDHHNVFVHKIKARDVTTDPAGGDGGPATMSEYIAQDLRSRLHARGELPNPLTLHAISDFYGVSLTPVRQAVNLLISGDCLRKRENGRIEVIPSSAALSDAPPGPPRPQASHDLDEKLAAEIIGLGLRGRAIHLREEETAERFRVGRTVLRQALNRLSGLGLIEHLPRRGWKVRACDERDLAAYLDVRETLELKAMDLAGPHLIDADLKRMLRGNRADTEMARLDNDLHGYLVEKSGNRHIRDFFDRQGAYYTTLFNYAAPEARVVAEMARQHRTILRALIARDWPRARLELSAHIRAQLPIVKELMRKLAREDAPSTTPSDGLP
jgi:DNA-binding GntR family transcriptional regulator